MEALAPPREQSPDAPTRIRGVTSASLRTTWLARTSRTAPGTCAPIRRTPSLASAALALALAACASIGASRATAQTIDPDKAAKVKAAYLLNFIRYTQWRDSTFESPTSPIVLTLVGECDVASILSKAVERSDPIGGRALTLNQQALPRGGSQEVNAFFTDLARSHLLYLCALTPDQSRTILERLNKAGVLTVGDTPRFAATGGMLGFVLRGDRIVFEANPKAIQTGEVVVSAKVLKLAQIVDSEERR